MEISGKIIAVLPMQSGTGKSGDVWQKQEYVIETPGQYPKKMCFNLWNDKIDQFGIQAGQDLDVSFDIDCREWNGKWFNDIKAWKVVQRNVSGANPVNQSQSPSSAQQSAPPANDAKDDLPF